MTAAPTSPTTPPSTVRKKGKGRGKGHGIWDNHRKSDAKKIGSTRGDYEVEEWRERDYEGVADNELSADDDASLLSFGHAVKPSSADDLGVNAALWRILAIATVYWAFH